LTPLEATALSGIAPLMRELAQNPRATCYYEMLSDALVWSDEFPDFAALRLVPDWDVIRFVFYFRTTVILGEPDENMREYWNEALQLFPDWPGFAPERQSTALHAVFRQKSAWARAEIEEIEREMDREAGEQAN
jgi:hypothetical protein